MRAGGDRQMKWSKYCEKYLTISAQYHQQQGTNAMQMLNLE